MELRRSSRLKALTTPISPKLLTTSRVRNYHVPSQEEKEEAEYEEMKRYKFRARPPPTSTFTGGETGVPKRLKKGPSKAKTPRVLKRKPAVKKSGISKAKDKTQPKKVNNKAINRLKALPLPDLQKVFEITKKDSRTVTKPQPFSFESRDPKPSEVREKLLKEQIEEERKKREFKAQPLYESEGFQVDKNLSKACTKVVPFNISKPDAYEEKLKNQKERLEKENLELAKKKEFKATYPYAIFEEPFEPVKDSRYCKVEEFNLHSEKRGTERKKFDMEREEQQRNMARLKEEEEKEKARREAEEVADLRKRLVHKANKVGEYQKQDYEELYQEQSNSKEVI